MVLWYERANSIDHVRSRREIRVVIENPSPRHGSRFQFQVGGRAKQGTRLPRLLPAGGRSVSASCMLLLLPDG